MSYTFLSHTATINISITNNQAQNNQSSKVQFFNSNMSNCLRHSPKHFRCEPGSLRVIRRSNRTYNINTSITQYTMPT